MIPVFQTSPSNLLRYTPTVFLGHTNINIFLLLKSLYAILADMGLTTLTLHIVASESPSQTTVLRIGQSRDSISFFYASKAITPSFIT
jgi:hypothetical protein